MTDMMMNTNTIMMVMEEGVEEYGHFINTQSTPSIQSIQSIRFTQSTQFTVHQYIAYHTTVHTDANLNKVGGQQEEGGI